MKKVLIVVEDPTLADALKNFFEYIKFPYRVSSINSRKFITGNFETMLLAVHTQTKQLPLLIQKMKRKFRSLKVIFLIKKEGSEIRKLLGKKKQGQFFYKTQDLMRIYGTVKRLREE
jgi:DNA-binding response OmpR family regulator